MEGLFVNVSPGWGITDWFSIVFSVDLSGSFPPHTKNDDLETQSLLFASTETVWLLLELKDRPIKTDHFSLLYRR